jgi:hypothetical protein
VTVTNLVQVTLLKGEEPHVESLVQVRLGMRDTICEHVVHECSTDFMHKLIWESLFKGASHLHGVSPTCWRVGSSLYE